MAKRTPAQKAASKRNLVKARASKSKRSSGTSLFPPPNTKGPGQVLTKRINSFRGLAIKKREATRKYTTGSR